MSSKSERKIRRVIDKVSSQFPQIQFFCDTTSDEARNCKVTHHIIHIADYRVLALTELSSCTSVNIAKPLEGCHVS